MIQTKVAKVVSTTELILAAGAEDGVGDGMEFIVYSLSEPVTDPETGEELGRLEIVKARLIAAHVQDHMTTARTKSRVKRAYDFGRAIGPEMEADQMAVEKSEPFREPDLIVRVGDLVRTVTAPAKTRNGALAFA